MSSSLILPLRQASHGLDGLLLRTGAMPGFCSVCGQMTVFRIKDPNFRESCVCWRCRSFNRQRQIAQVVLKGVPGSRARSLSELARTRDLAIYNTESARAIHNTLKAMAAYTCSEYLGPSHTSGEVVNGVMHQDLQALSFPDSSLDLVISGDVFEHVPRPYVAHQEVFRVLTPGGRHVFTVPFHEFSLKDEIRARPGPDGQPELLMEPIYHLDPVDPKGALVYTIFGIESLVRLGELGFDARLHHLYDPWLGILGGNGYVFEAIKMG